MDIIDFFNRDENHYSDFIDFVSFTTNFSNKNDKVNFIDNNIITAINTRLDKAATHYQGLSLIFNYASKVSKDNLSKSFNHWIGKIIQILNHAPNHSKELRAVSKSINALIICCKQVPELDKIFSIHNVKQIVGISVERFHEEKNIIFLNLLITLLYYYPEPCTKFQAPIRQITSLCIDEKNNLVIYGARCYSLLIRALERTFGQSCKDHSTIVPENSSASCHVFYQMNLCNNLYSIIDELFQNLITVTSDLPCNFQDNINVNTLILPTLPCNDMFEHYSAIENRFTNICAYLSTLIKVGTSGGKKYVLPNVILQVINRGLSITAKNLQKNYENKKDMLLFILPKLHSGLFEILQTLIMSFQQELLPFALTIQQIILQTLEWTQTFSEQLFRSVRLHAYKSLSMWLTRSRSLSGFQLMADEFVSHVLKDLIPPDKNILLVTTKLHKTSKSKGKNEKLNGNQNIKSCNYHDSHEPDYIHSTLYLEILLTVQSILSNVNTYLKPSLYIKIRDTIVLLLFKQYVNNLNTSSDQFNIECRIQLLKILRILQMYSHTSTPSPTSYAIKIFGLALSQENNSKIIEEASLGLAELRHVVYPGAPTLMLPLSEPTVPHSITRSLSPKLLKSSNLHQSGLNLCFLTNEQDISVNSNKRPKLDEKNSKPTINIVEPDNNTDLMSGDEMSESFCDELSSNQAI